MRKLVKDPIFLALLLAAGAWFYVGRDGDLMFVGTGVVMIGGAVLRLIRRGRGVDLRQQATPRHLTDVQRKRWRLVIGGGIGVAVAGVLLSLAIPSLLLVLLPLSLFLGLWGVIAGVMVLRSVGERNTAD